MFPKMSLHQVQKLKTSDDLPFVTYVENLKSPDLLVYFGNYNGHARGITTIESLNCNALVMRSHEASWYLEEFPHGKTPEEVAAALDKFIDSKPHIKNVTYAGFSMGGFGALLYPTFAKRVDKIVATSPQTKFPDFIVGGKIHTLKEEFSAYRSIKELWDKHGAPDAEILLQACENRLETEGYNDLGECMELNDFARVVVKIYNCIGHNGISANLLSDLNYYNNSFLYRP